MSAPSLVCLGGHDSSGRAGVDADREVAVELGFAPCCVVTVWTEQDDGGLHAMRPRSSEEWGAEAEAALEQGALGLKVGLLGGAAQVPALERVLDACLERGLPVVVDPVLGASTGESFLDPLGIEAWRTTVLTRDVVVTPNLPEALRLIGREMGESEREDPTERLTIARSLLEAGARGVVLKGGHGREDPVQDLVLERCGEPHWHRHPRLPGPGIRGSGCRHATALLCGLMRGLDLAKATALAGELLCSRLRHASA